MKLFIFRCRLRAPTTLNMNFYNFHPCFCAGRTKQEPTTTTTENVRLNNKKNPRSSKCIAFYHAIESIEFVCYSRQTDIFGMERQQIHVRFTWASNGNISHCNRKTKEKQENRIKNTSRIRWNGASHFTGNKNRFFFLSPSLSESRGLNGIFGVERGRQFVSPTQQRSLCQENAPFRHATENALRP